MKTRKALLVALVAVAAIGLAHVASADPFRVNSEGPAPLAGRPDACDPGFTPDAAADPLPGLDGFSTPQPQPMAPCQNYAWMCTVDGGPCGPLGLCHCQENPGFWICAR